jgi:predicted ATPase/DNA-binding winged helix-turn-helix (wHTH) protein
MPSQPIRFEDFELSTESFELRQGAHVIDLEPQEFSMLAYLASHPDVVVTREDLLNEVWGHQYVTDSAISTRIKGIRKALQDDGRQQRLIQTVRGRGFRFVGTQAERPAPTAAQAPVRNLTNLPRERTPMFGRDALRQQCRRSLVEHRLISLLGIGGCGKTRLAISVGHAALQDFDDGVWFVDLVPCHDLRQVETSIADAIGVAVAGADQSSALTEALSARRLAIVLDNCEHVIDHAATVVDRILDDTPHVHFLTTSRIPLELTDEVRIPVPTLDTDSSGDAQPAAVEMFSACAHRMGCALAPADMDSASSVCQHLDGLPLAIDLAAAQLRYLSLTDLSERLDRRFDLLSKQTSPGDERGSSLHGVLEYTYGLLDAQEQYLLGQLAIFPSTFDFTAVDGAAAGKVNQLVATFAGLVEKALLVRTEADGRRWRVLETVRMFVMDQCDKEARHAYRENHAAWVLQAFDIPLNESFFDFSQSWWCVDHFADLRSAERFLFDNQRVEDGAQLLIRQALALLQDLGPRAVSMLARLELYPERLTDPILRAKLHSAGVFFSRGAGDMQHMAHHSEMALAMAKVADDVYTQGFGRFMGTWTRLADPETMHILDEVEAIDWHENDASRDAILLFRGYVLAHQHRWEEISVLLSPLVERVLTEDSSVITYASSTAVGLWGLSRMLEDPQAALLALEEKDRGHADEASLEITLYYMKALVAAAAGKAGRAVELCQIVRARLAQVQYSYASEVLLPCVMLAHSQGDTDRAREWLSHALPTGGTTNLLPLGSARVCSLYPEVVESGADSTRRNKMADDAVEWAGELV